MNPKDQFQKARAVLQALIHGLDPETGAELPEGAIVNRIVVNRSMNVAVTALEQVEARMLRRAQLPESVGKTWTAEEEQQLRSEFANSEPIPSIATHHGRTVRAIEVRLEMLGLRKADQRTTSKLVRRSIQSEGQ